MGGDRRQGELHVRSFAVPGFTDRLRERARSRSENTGGLAISSHCAPTPRSSPSARRLRTSAMRSPISKVSLGSATSSVRSADACLRSPASSARMAASKLRCRGVAHSHRAAASRSAAQRVPPRDGAPAGSAAKRPIGATRAWFSSRGAAPDDIDQLAELMEQPIGDGLLGRAWVGWGRIGQRWGLGSGAKVSPPMFGRREDGRAHADRLAVGCYAESSHPSSVWGGARSGAKITGLAARPRVSRIRSYSASTHATWACERVVTALPCGCAAQAPRTRRTNSTMPGTRTAQINARPSSESTRSTPRWPVHWR